VRRSRSPDSVRTIASDSIYTGRREPSYTPGSLQGGPELSCAYSGSREKAHGFSRGMNPVSSIVISSENGYTESEASPPKPLSRSGAVLARPEPRHPTGELPSWGCPSVTGPRPPVAVEPHDFSRGRSQLPSRPTLALSRPPRPDLRVDRSRSTCHGRSNDSSRSSMLSTKVYSSR